MSEPTATPSGDMRKATWERAIALALHDIIIDSGALGLTREQQLEKLRPLAEAERVRLGVSLLDPAIQSVMTRQKTTSTRKFRDLLLNPGLFAGRLNDPAWRVSLVVGKVSKALQFMTPDDFEIWMEARRRNVANAIRQRDRDQARIDHVVAAMLNGHFRTFGDAFAAGAIDGLALEADEDEGEADE